jgi:septal ring factor EnvC (AmiA/AmiB activator)
MAQHLHSRAGDLLPNESVKPRPDEKRATMKIDGTITYGNILAAVSAIAAAGIAWGVLTSQVSQQRQEFTSAISDIKDSIREQRLETKDLQKSMNAITTDTALIRGRLASGDSNVTRSK